MARTDRGSGNVADGPPDEHPVVGSLRAILRPAAAQEIPHYPSAGTRCGSTGRKSKAAQKCSYILGNPPFVGASELLLKGLNRKPTWNPESEAALKTAGLLDYLSRHGMSKGELIQGTQGSKRPSSLPTAITLSRRTSRRAWNPLFQRSNLKIHFAHRTFSWESELVGSPRARHHRLRRACRHDEHFFASTTTKAKTVAITARPISNRRHKHGSCSVEVDR